MLRSQMAAAVLVSGITTAALSADLHLSADHYWVAMASRQDVNEAIAVARRYSPSRALVVRAINGWYAVVEGPQFAKQGFGRTVLDDLIKAQGIPRDAYLTRGDGYVDVVWRPPPSPAIASKSYDGNTDTALQEGNLRVLLSKTPMDGEASQAPTAKGYFKGKPAFGITITDSPNEKPASEISVIRLDPNSPSPQAVFTYFWQGAHCCTVTKIATMHWDGTWKTVDGETLDGEGGYQFEDLDGSGLTEMISADQSFYYTFASFADSVAPIRIHKLVGDRIIDVTEEPRFRDRLTQELIGIEGDTKSNDQAWHNNGFLAGWVAAKMLIGQGPEAWSKMLTGYDHNPDFGPEECSINIAVENCPEDKKVRVDFPMALKQFLIQHGYIHDATLYPTPKRSMPQASSSPTMTGLSPAMNECIGSAETARRLIYQSFIGRRMRESESFDLVTLQDDTTVEANDQGIERVVCAVTYDMNIKSLIGRLAEDGDIQRAATLNRLMRRSGPTVSNRVKYSVKPTATPGQSFIELLP